MLARPGFFKSLGLDFGVLPAWFCELRTSGGFLIPKGLTILGLLGEFLLFRLLKPSFGFILRSFPEASQTIQTVACLKSLTETGSLSR